MSDGKTIDYALCPRCGSDHVTAERTPNGLKHCIKCDLCVRHGVWAKMHDDKQKVSTVEPPPLPLSTTSAAAVKIESWQSKPPVTTDDKCQLVKHIEEYHLNYDHNLTDYNESFEAGFKEAISRLLYEVIPLAKAGCISCDRIETCDKCVDYIKRED